MKVQKKNGRLQMFWDLLAPLGGSKVALDSSENRFPWGLGCVEVGGLGASCSGPIC